MEPQGPQGPQSPAKFALATPVQDPQLASQPRFQSPFLVVCFVPSHASSLVAKIAKIVFCYLILYIPTYVFTILFSQEYLSFFEENHLAD